MRLPTLDTSDLTILSQSVVSRNSIFNHNAIFSTSHFVWNSALPPIHCESEYIVKVQEPVKVVPALCLAESSNCLHTEGQK